MKKLQQDIKNDPTIRDQIPDLDYYCVCTYGNFLAPILVAVHTVNNLDLGKNKKFEDEWCEID